MQLSDQAFFLEQCIVYHKQINICFIKIFLSYTRCWIKKNAIAKIRYYLNNPACWIVLIFLSYMGKMLNYNDVIAKIKYY